jgi:hypothetical protein
MKIAERRFLQLGALYYLEVAGGVVLVIFGILFFLYLPINFSEVTTIIIFIGAGILIIRKAVLDRREAKVQTAIQSKKNPRNGSPKKARQP